MSKLDVRIVKLEPMTVACTYGFGKEPEGIASSKMTTWAKAKGFYDDPEHHPTFGFNNPDPSPGSPNYGYEIWMKVDADTTPEGDVTIKQFAGGTYAVTRFTGLSRIGEVWKQLVAWREASPYQCGHHQWLEHLRNWTAKDLEQFVFDLYLPIEA
ncbi:MAG: GyrI-like domain-containing protein [Chloroflexi bacterium]|nr:GyrI-like domain-containing protein [Chloroflexota bacterium]